MYTGLRNTFRWHVRNSIAIPSLLKPQTAALAMVSSGNMLPLLGSESASQEQQVALRQPADFNNMEIVAARLATTGAYVGNSSVPFLGDVCDGTDYTTFADMAGMGMVKLSHDEYGELMVAVNPRWIDWKNTIGLAWPLPLCRIETDAALLKKSKIELMIMLHRAGWEPSGETLEPYVVGGTRAYVSDSKKPLSYLAALVFSANIFEKGVPSIRHNGVDSYYRCLITLLGQRLAACLQALEEGRTSAFKALLAPADLEEQPETVPALAVLDAAEAADEGAEDSGIVNMLPPLASPDAWTRVIAHVGGDSHRLRIYFDQLSKNSLAQRAFCDCRHHDACVWCRNVTIDSKRRFCAMLYSWELQGRAFPDRASKGAHLSFDVPEEHIIAVEIDIVLEDF